MSIYEFAVLGCVSPGQRKTLTDTIGKMVAEFGFSINVEVKIHDAETVAQRNRSSAFSAVYFGGEVHLDVEAASSLLSENSPVIPVVKRFDQFSGFVPDFLQATNGCCLKSEDPEMTELATAMLECVGLLRRQRRVFVSYRRNESREAALQMHDLLSSRGFDVFLDTHDIRPGDPFQEVLWHRLCDSDVLVMLDTPAYFESRWTREEIGRARAKEIHILRVIWPGHQPTKMTDLSETIYLDEEDLESHSGPIINEKADEIALKVEGVRSRSIAARYMSITGRLRADVVRIGASFEGVGAHRAIAIRLLDDRRIWAYPVVGVPTAETLNDIANKALLADQKEIPVLVYDDIGIREAWSAHLKWLEDNIQAVRGLKIAQAGWMLAAWE